MNTFTEPDVCPISASWCIIQRTYISVQIAHYLFTRIRCHFRTKSCRGKEMSCKQSILFLEYNTQNNATLYCSIKCSVCFCLANKKAFCFSLFLQTFWKPFERFWSVELGSLSLYGCSDLHFSTCCYNAKILEVKQKKSVLDYEPSLKKDRTVY